jgi:hypothetical protein
LEVSRTRVYWVEWVDSAALGRGEWTDLDSDMEVATCVSAGLLVRDEPDYIVLAVALDDSEHAAGLMSIPRVAITLMKSWDSLDS